LSKQVEIRGSIRYSIETKESRSIDRAENIKELNARSLDTKVELKPIRLRTRINPKTSSESLIEEGSVCGRSLPIFIIYRINQTGTRISLCSCSLKRTDPDFFSQCFKSDNKVMKFLISYRTSDRRLN
jgi:hypothetical protein